MPDVSFPSITVRVSYAGVGPLEMEELVTRPIEQALSAVAGLERLESTSQEGSARVTLNLAWGTDLNEAADDIRNRLDRVRGRLPEEADAPVMFKFDASAFPIMGVGLEGDYDRVKLREIAEHDLSQRLERVPGVAAVTVEGGLRRQIHVELSKEKIRALDLPVDRVVNLLRTENQNIPLGEIDEGDRTYPRPQPGPVREPERDQRPRRDDARGRAGLHARHRGDQGLDRGLPFLHAHQRQAGRAAPHHQAVRNQHG